MLKAGSDASSHGRETTWIVLKEDSDESQCERETALVEVLKGDTDSVRESHKMECIDPLQL